MPTFTSLLGHIRRNPASRLLPILLAAVGLWAVLIIPANLFIVRQMHHQDIDQRYIGAHGVVTSVLAGETPLSPYAPEVTLQIQESIYGRPARPDEDPQAFAYPAHITILLLPLWLLPSLELAASVWTALLFAVLLLVPTLAGSYFGWRIGWRTQLIGLVFGTLAFRYSMMALVLGQFTIFVFACLLGSLWAISARRTLLTAIFLTGMTVRPEGAVLAVLVVGLALANRQFRAGAIWVGLMILSWLLTTALIGPWLGDFFASLRAYGGYASPDWLPQIAGPAGSILITLGVLCWSGWICYDSRGLPLRERLAWQVSAIILGTLILLPQTNPYTLVYALLPIWTALWAGRKHAGLWIITLAALAASWWFFAQSLNVPEALDQLLLPLALALILTRARELRRAEMAAGGLGFSAPPDR